MVGTFLLKKFRARYYDISDKSTQNRTLLPIDTSLNDSVYKTS